MIFPFVCSTETDSWLERFHAGQRDVLEACYRDHFDLVYRAVARIVSGPDRETIVHEVFFRLISSVKQRSGFKGGSFEAWIRTVARNRAIDFLRHHKRETLVDPETVASLASREEIEREDATHAYLLIEKFLAECLPGKWRPVFEARFIKQLSQREAARELGMRRTTLAYQEHQVRKLLRRFLLRLEEP